MISHPRTHKGAVLIAAYVMFACVAALLSVNLTSPTSAALGADWQCSRFALVVPIAAYAMFAYVAALLLVNLTSPTSAALSTDWQCSRFALVFTTCTPVRAPEADFHWRAQADLGIVR